MNFCDISGEVKIILEGNEKIRILKKSIKSPIILSEEQLNKKVLEIELSYTFHEKQISTIENIKRDFEAYEDGVIKTIPRKKFRIANFEGITILKYGICDINPGMLGLAEKVGITAYWDKANMIICSSKAYKKIMDQIISIIRPDKARFDIRMDSWGPNLRIIAI